MAIQMENVKTGARFEVGSEFEAEMAGLRGNRRVDAAAPQPRPRAAEARPASRAPAPEPEGPETGQAGTPPTT